MKRDDGIFYIAIALAVFFTICLSVLLNWPAEAEEPEPNYTTMYVLCKPNSFVNVREFPKKNGKPAGRLECGDEVLTLGEKRGQFMKIYGPTFEAGELWIHAGYLTEEKPEIFEDGKEYTVIGKGRVALRRYIRGQRRAWTRPGKTLKVYAITSEWALTNRGFIRSEYLEAKDEDEPEPVGADLPGYREGGRIRPGLFTGIRISLPVGNMVQIAA